MLNYKMSDTRKMEQGFKKGHRELTKKDDEKLQVCIVVFGMYIARQRKLKA